MTFQFILGVRLVVGVGAGTVEVVIDVAVAALVLDVKMKIVAPIVVFALFMLFLQISGSQPGCCKKLQGCRQFLSSIYWKLQIGERPNCSLTKEGCLESNMVQKHCYRYVTFDDPGDVVVFATVDVVIAVAVVSKILMLLLLLLLLFVFVDAGVNDGFNCWTSCSDLQPPVNLHWILSRVSERFCFKEDQKNE